MQQVVRIKFCKHCNCWNAVFICPRCNEETRCSEIADSWSNGVEDLDDYPIVECGACDFVTEINELEKETSAKVVFSVVGYGEEDEDEEDDRGPTANNESYYLHSFDQ